MLNWCVWDDILCQTGRFYHSIIMWALVGPRSPCDVLVRCQGRFFWVGRICIVVVGNGAGVHSRLHIVWDRLLVLAQTLRHKYLSFTSHSKDKTKKVKWLAKGHKRGGLWRGCKLDIMNFVFLLTVPRQKGVLERIHNVQTTTSWSRESFSNLWYRKVGCNRPRTMSRYCMCITLLCVCYMYGAFIPFPYCTPPSCEICILMICKLVDSYNVSDAASTSVNKLKKQTKNYHENRVEMTQRNVMIDVTSHGVYAIHGVVTLDMTHRKGITLWWECESDVLLPH
jgi:hypothetical protein